MNWICCEVVSMQFRPDQVHWPLEHSSFRASFASGTPLDAACLISLWASLKILNGHRGTGSDDDKNSRYLRKKCSIINCWFKQFIVKCNIHNGEIKQWKLKINSVHASKLQVAKYNSTIVGYVHSSLLYISMVIDDGLTTGEGN